MLYGCESGVGVGCDVGVFHCLSWSVVGIVWLEGCFGGLWGVVIGLLMLMGWEDGFLGRVGVKVGFRV